MILPQTNNNLPVGEKHVQYGEFLCWLGLWMLMGTLIGPQRPAVWATHPINAFHGAPLCLGVWMSRKHFDTILSALSFTDAIPPTFLDKFWEIQQIVEVWGVNMEENFVPGYMNCLDKSMSIWTNKFTCPGFMFIPRKPWPFGNEYHTICCCTSGRARIVPELLGSKNLTTWVPQLDCCFGCLPHIPQGVCGHPGQWLLCPQGHWFTTTSCTAMLWMTTMESNTHQSA